MATLTRHVADLHGRLIARMPLFCAKSARIQRHDGIAKEAEWLDRRTQFETGLTGTPYATDRSI
jgi:uncharacterized protein (DUF2126 family)